jgi:hypothetical protein
MRTTHLLPIAVLAACAETQPLPDDPDDPGQPDYVAAADARQQSNADARPPLDSRPPSPDAGPGGTDGCGTLTAGGRCSGTTLTWCSSGDERTIDCATTGKDCTCDGDFCDCTTGGGSTGSGGCGSVTFQGQCSGNTLRYCENNNLVTVDCSQQLAFCDCPPYELCDCW